MPIASCIGCGCTDVHACQTDDGSCHWLEVEYNIQRGVCSACSDQLPRWHAGERSILMLVAKITKEGATDPFYIESNDMVSFPHVLEVSAGDKFTVEWVEMPTEEFEALPQFKHLHLAEQWASEFMAATQAEKSGLADEARKHRIEAKRIASEVKARGYTVEELVGVL
jgi:hypothetical protein